MDIIWLILGVILFFIIYYAVSLAIRPLINDKVDVVKDKETQLYDRLIKLRDIGIISVEEFDKIVQLEAKDKEDEQALEYEELLEELNKLRELEILSDMEYQLKTARLKEYFKI